MKRAFLAYEGHSLQLREGTIVIGRGLACDMRFNDASVSREHARIRLSSGRITLEDLGSRNGTLLNGQPLTEVARLENGDFIQIGIRTIEVRILGVEDPLEEDTSAGREMPREQPPGPIPTIGSVREQRCPRCRNPVSPEDELCRTCGFGWGDFRPGAVTQRVSQVEKRRHARHRVEVPVLYASDNLTVESIALDLSRSGVFVGTQILDEVGTQCELTLMADGAPAITLRGEVRRVVEREERGRPLGLGIEFKDLGTVAQHWLDDTITRLRTRSPGRGITPSR